MTGGYECCPATAFLPPPRRGEGGTTGGEGSARRERFEAKVRRCVTELATSVAVDAIFEPDATRRVNGTELRAGEFNQRDGLRAIPNLGNHMQGRARDVMHAMCEDGTLTLRLIERGRNPWRIMALAPERSQAHARDAQLSEPAPDWLIELAERCQRGELPLWVLANAVDRHDDRTPVSLVRDRDRHAVSRWAAQDEAERRAKEHPATRGDVREARREALLERARHDWPNLSDDAPLELLNRLRHESPSWMWSTGHPRPEVRRWERSRSDDGAEGRLLHPKRLDSIRRQG